MSIKITSPIKGFTGKTAFGPMSVEFVDGVAEVGKLGPGIRDYLKARGYKIGKNTTPATVPADSESTPFDPAEHTVEEVQAHLAGLDDTDAEKRDAEVNRVVEAEKAGKNRSTLLDAITGTDGQGGDGQ